MQVTECVKLSGDGFQFLGKGIESRDDGLIGLGKCGMLSNETL